MSLFIAISLPESTSEQIFAIIQDKEIPEELWERKGDLHITMLFLQNGNAKLEYLQSIKDRLKKLSIPSFDLKMDGFDFWTLKESQQILHLKVKPSKELMTLQAEIVSLFPEIPKPTYEFTPHISLLRSSEITKSKVEELKNKFSDISTDAFTVNQIHLYIGQRGKAVEDNKRNRYRIAESFSG